MAMQMIASFGSECSAFIGRHIKDTDCFTLIATGGIVAAHAVFELHPNTYLALIGGIATGNAVLLLAHIFSSRTRDCAKVIQLNSMIESEVKLHDTAHKRYFDGGQVDASLLAEIQQHDENYTQLLGRSIRVNTFLNYMFDNDVDPDVPTALVVAKSTLCMSVLPLVLYNAERFGNWLFTGVFVSLIAFNIGMRTVGLVNGSRINNLDLANGYNRNTAIINDE